MIEWIINLTEPERWLYGIVSTIVTGLIIVLANQRINHSLTTRRERHKKIILVSATFRKAINTETLGDFKGHQLENILYGVTTGTGMKIEGEFFKHRRAVHEYRVHLGCLDRFRLNHAWKTYTGGNKEYPDLFVRYCLPDDGPEKLKHDLLALRKIGEKR